ncbi:MAG: hypothetical protein UZ17_ACD001002523 [Acidobacteria bacterium OLB17]|nr:MAG: hypothetical protein UZ17_ACD001002523 [Acidobacteria bacterium OLB17]MCZ2390384.1 DUF2585 family protein [Acidobacteriota bacterium]
MELQERPLFDRRTVIIALCIGAVAALILASQGRVLWCKVGDLLPWSFDIWSTHNSQHLLDPYSFTHMLHGVAEFWILFVLFGKVPVKWRLLMAVAIEACWEVAENSAFVIERYRAATISLDYFGDSILNSLSDIAFCTTGFVIASKLRFVRSLILFIATEAILILTIRDSLLLNVLMLLYPIEAVKHWQMGVG